MERVDQSDDCSAAARAEQAKSDVARMHSLYAISRFSTGVAVAAAGFCLWRGWMAATWVLIGLAVVLLFTLTTMGLIVGQRGRQQLIKLKREGEAGRAGTSPTE